MDFRWFSTIWGNMNPLNPTNPESLEVPLVPKSGHDQHYAIVDDPNHEVVASFLQQDRKFPLISVVMPTYNTDEKLLREAVGSVINQTYPYWELCIADDNSPIKETRKLIEELAATDERIKTVYRNKNGKIAAATNSAIKITTGEYIAFLDHDDLLPKNALLFVAREIVRNPSISLIYSDEDKVDVDGNRYSPHFKPDWNYDLFLCQNYVNHFTVIKKSVIKKVGGLKNGYDGSQDHELLLRVISKIEAKDILHIPLILYHWRAVVGSTALSAEYKKHSRAATMRAVTDHFTRNKISAKIVEVKEKDVCRVKYKLPSRPPLVSIIVPTKDMVHLLKKCIDSLTSLTTYKNYEVMVINNSSVEKETLKYFKKINKLPKVRVLDFEHPFNYSAINNFAVHRAKGSVLVLLNNDIEVVEPGWLTEMVSHAIREDIGAVGAKLLYPNEIIQHAGVLLGLGGVAGHAYKRFNKNDPGYYQKLNLVQNYSAVTAACLAIEKRKYIEAGGLDEHNLSVAFNDVDFCIRVRNLGYRNLWTPFSTLIHHESLSRGYEDTPEKQQRFQREVEYMKNRWGEQLMVDPCYNPTLTLNREDYSVCNDQLVKRHQIVSLLADF